MCVNLAVAEMAKNLKVAGLNVENVAVVQVVDLQTPLRPALAADLAAFPELLPPQLLPVVRAEIDFAIPLFEALSAFGYLLGKIGLWADIHCGLYV